MSISGRVDSKNVLYTYNGLLFALKIKEIPKDAVTWMNLEDMPSEISQSQRNKY